MGEHQLRKPRRVVLCPPASINTAKQAIPVSPIRRGRMSELASVVRDGNAGPITAAVAHRFRGHRRLVGRYPPAPAGPVGRHCRPRRDRAARRHSRSVASRKIPLYELAVNWPFPNTTAGAARYVVRDANGAVLTEGVVSQNGNASSGLTNGGAGFAAIGQITATTAPTSR